MIERVGWDDDWICFTFLLILWTDVVDQEMMWPLSTYIFSWLYILNRSSNVVVGWFYFYCLIFFMHSIPLSIYSLVMKYYAHFLSSRPSSEVLNFCSQLLTAVCMFSYIVCSKLFIQPLAYCHLLFTSPMICFVNDW